MPGQWRARIIAHGVILVASAAAHAEVLDADSNGFSVRYSTAVKADRMTAYDKAVNDVSEWWSDDHTVSGDAANLYLTTDLQGCLCESLGDNAGLVHMTVTFANPGVMLRLSGGLGPLGLMGVAGNMTWEFDEIDDSTTITLQYSVGGYMAGGLDSIAPAVDSVLVDAMNRLTSYIETGLPVRNEEF